MGSCQRKLISEESVIVAAVFRLYFDSRVVIYDTNKMLCGQ